MLDSLAFTFVEATTLHNEQTIFTPILYFSKGGTNASNNGLTQGLSCPWKLPPLGGLLSLLLRGVLFIFLFSISLQRLLEMCVLHVVYRFCYFEYYHYKKSSIIH